MSHDFEKKIENLKKENAIEISKFEKEVEFLKSRENFKFTKLHEKRMEVLEETYKHINELYYSLVNFVSPAKFGDSKNEKSPDQIAQENFNKIYGDFFYLLF